MRGGARGGWICLRGEGRWLDLRGTAPNTLVLKKPPPASPRKHIQPPLAPFCKFTSTSRPTSQISTHLPPHLSNVLPPKQPPHKATLDATFNTSINVEAVAGRRQSLSWRCPRLFAVTPALLCARPLKNHLIAQIVFPQPLRAVQKCVEVR